MDSTLTLSFSLNQLGELSAFADPETADALLTSVEAGRYVLLSELARGGMGVVFAARDLALGRYVAVKVLRKEYQHCPEVAERFLEEGRITGRLQHPGIPPVHNLGALPDGRPFLAMKLIEGRTLARLLKERATPGDDLPHFLHVFERVSQTVAYAHSRNVIHRDLKPSNVMVGEFGEVQVVDWGVARVLSARPGRVPPADGSTEYPVGATVVCDPPAASHTEGVIGTPAYMPPEQARGRRDQTNTRSDVFALGAILCEMLTGVPPFTGSRTTIRAMARGGDVHPAFVRLDASGADEELVWLAKRCLSPDPGDRPRDAAAVAAAVAEYRAGVEHRLRRAEVERAETAVRESERGKRRRAQLALAVAGFLLVLGTGVFAWLQDRQDRERQVQKARDDARSRESVAARLAEAEATLRADDLATARAILERVGATLPPNTPERLRERFAGLTADRNLADALEAAVDLQPPRPRPAGDGPPGRDESGDHAELFRRYGLDLRAGDPDEIAARIQLSPIRARLIDGLDAALSRSAFSGVDIPRLLPAVLRRVDDDPARNAVRDAVFARDSRRLLGLVRKLTAPSLTPGFAVHLVGQQFGLPAAERLRVLTAAHHEHPNNFRVNQLLCLLHLASVGEGDDARVGGPLAEATTHASSLVALRPQSPTGYRLLASALRRSGQLDRAMEALRKAVERTEAPDQVGALKYQIGAIIRQKSGAEEAFSYFRHELRQNHDDAYAHWNLGRAFHEHGDLAAALGRFTRAIELRPAEGAFYPVTAQVHRQRGELDRAVAVYEQAARDARPLRWSHVAGLGPLLILQGKYHRAVRAQERLMAEFPECAGAPGTRVRYDAARAAALAGTVGGIEPDPAAGRATLRRKALGWLRDDLAASGVELAVDPGRAGAEARVRKWIQDPAFARVRHPFFLALLPPDEAREWVAFWDEVRRFRDEAELARGQSRGEKRS